MKSLLRLLVMSVACVWGVSLQAANFRTVVIDAGHGGQDLGGQWGQVYEKHLALDTATRLQNQLKRMGYRTVMVRNSDYFVPLQERSNIANRYRDAIFVSIHFNYTGKSHVNGLETFYYSRQGQRLAQNVQGYLVNRTHATDRTAKFARFFVLRNCQLPAILVEGGFVTNSSDRALMKSGGYREAIARAIADGIQRYRYSS